MFNCPMMVDVSGKRRLGHVLKHNRYTVRVRIMEGAKSFFDIKRHKQKHHCKWKVPKYI